MAKTVELTTEQIEAIEEIERNLQIIACAGSGKTEVITRRIANILHCKPDVRPENIVAFTFTEKAAASLKERILSVLGEHSDIDIEGIYVGTIHGFCYHLLNRYGDKYSDRKILDTVKSHLFVNRYNKECGMSDLELEPYPRNINLFLQCIEKLIDDYDNSAAWTDQQREILDKYIDCVYGHRYIDFSLMIFETLRQIKENPTVAQSLRSIRYLVVDEYQDVDDLQEKLIQSIADAGANVCVVGDDDQTIYQFRGSNAGNMITFAERYHDVHQVRLEKNFRCAPGIVDVAGRIISHNERRLQKKMSSDVRRSSETIKAFRASDRDEQFNMIAEQIERLHTEGVPYGEMAILVRKGKTIAPLSSVLEHLGIPYETDCAEHFFLGEYFSRFVNTLQTLDEVNKATLFECWEDLVDVQSFNAAFRFLRSCARGGNGSLSDILRGFCDRIVFLNESAGDAEERKNALNGICKILDDYDEIYGDWQLSARVTGVLRFLGTQAPNEYKYYSFATKETGNDAIHIMTVHKAKGLEFHTVFLPELMSREFPVTNMGGKKYWHVLGGVFEENKARYESDLEDERKLFYVAVTRARENLYLSYELTSQPVSCFVAEAAESHYLQIDRADLTFRPKEVLTGKDLGFSSEYDTSRTQRESTWAEERQQRQVFWATVKYARQQLYDYYGTACHFCKGAYGDLTRIKSMSPEQILEEASRNRLI